MDVIVLSLNFERYFLRSRHPTPVYASVFFELPVVLAAQALLPRVQDQAGESVLVTINIGEARVEVGREIERLKIPMFGREPHRLRDGPRQ